MRAKQIERGRRHWRVAVVLIWVAALVSVSCASSTETTSADTAAVADEGAATEGVRLSSDPTSLLRDATEMDEIVRLGRRLVLRLASDDAATDALLLAGERGYSGPQILAGLDADLMQADGTIEGVAPARPALGIIDLSAVKATGRLEDKPARGAAVRQDDDGLVLVERLRQAGQAGMSRWESNELVGIAGVTVILMLLRAGATPEQVIEVLILGGYSYEEDGWCYWQNLPLETEPERKRCDGSDGEPDERTTSPAAEEPAEATDAVVPIIGATYRGDLGIDDSMPESEILITISPEGEVTGHLTAREELANYVASIDFGCGLLDDDEDCSGAVIECPATVLWSADLSPLTFTGDAPDNGTVSGAIEIVFDTTPQGCGEPVTDIQPTEVMGTARPDGGTITSPLSIELERVQPES